MRKQAYSIVNIVLEENIQLIHLLTLLPNNSEVFLTINNYIHEYTNLLERKKYRYMSKVVY